MSAYSMVQKKSVEAEVLIDGIGMSDPGRSRGRNDDCIRVNVEMGCTGALILVTKGGHALGHLGDRRTSRIRGSTFQKLTKDHSVVQEQLDLGLITPGEVRAHPLAHHITRAVGIEKTPLRDVIIGTAAKGDRPLLCTDGLTNMLDIGLIRSLLEREQSLEATAERLFHKANQAGRKVLKRSCIPWRTSSRIAIIRDWTGSAKCSDGACISVSR